MSVPPVGKYELMLLEHLLTGPGETPLGIGTMTMTKLLQKGWAAPHSEAGAKLYTITDAGRLALQRQKQARPK